jgi:DinB superfamily
MIATLDLLQQLRAQRRQMLRSLADLTEDQLTIRVPVGSSDVRATLLSLIEDDDHRCAAIAAILQAAEWQPSEAQRILAALARTRGYLRGVLVGLTDEVFDRPPGPDEWSVRQALQHIRNNEQRFVADVGYAVERLIHSESSALERPDPDRGPGTLGLPLPEGFEGALAALEATRDEVVGATATLGAEQLSAPTSWAGRTVDIRFMLHRRATHERQHTVQVEKTLRAIGSRQTEVQLLLRQAEIARGALEGLLAGVPDDLLRRETHSDLPDIEDLVGRIGDEESEKVGVILAVVG